MLSSLRSLSHLTFAFPDISIGISFILLSFVKITVGEKCSKAIFSKLSIILAGTCFAITLICVHVPINKEFESSLFTYTIRLTYMKSIAFGLLTVILTLLNYIKESSLSSTFYILVFGLINAVTICISANNFLSIILGLELYSFSVCFLLLTQKGKITNQRKAVRFILASAIMTTVLFFGVSLCYCQSGSLLFSKINLDNSIISTIGIILIFSALLFKVGAAPFHSWMVDIYEKASTILVLLLDAVWKFFMMFTIIKIFSIIISCDSTQRYIALAIISVISMIIGGIMPFFEKNIKKFIAYASIGHIGFISTVFAITNNLQSTSIIMSYLGYYSLTSLCFFSSILFLERHNVMTTFRDLSGLIHKNIPLCLCIFVSIFSMAGFPPFTIFLTKLSIFKLLLETKNYTLLTLAIAYSSITLLYTVKCLRYLFKKEESKFARFTEKRIFFIIQIIVQVLSIFTYGGITKKFLWIVTGL